MSLRIMGLTTKLKKLKIHIYISLQILKFLNVCVLSNIGPINMKLKDFVKLSVLFLNNLYGSCVVYPIIHGLVPRPPPYEIRQYDNVSLLL